MTLFADPAPLPTPGALKAELPLTGAERIGQQRQQIKALLDGDDDRLLVIIGPCSVHDPAAALEYGQKLATLAAELSGELLVVMRTYFEKPRTRHGWKGLVYDPAINGRFDTAEGLYQARKLLLALHQAGLPLATEFLDLTTGHYWLDLVSFGAIGARTTESQVHRALASALPCPVGFKNGTDGNVRIAVDAIRAAAEPQPLFAPADNGQLQALSSHGNRYCQLILRGGAQPNYDAAAVNDACAQLRHAALPEQLLIDFSHGNSRKDHRRQLDVAADICQQLASGEQRIKGVMVESFLAEGSQPAGEPASLVYGKSITDACLNWDDSAALLQRLAEAVKQRRG